MFARAHSLIFLLLGAPACWGLSSQELASRLAKNDKWLRLGHYEKTVTGYRSPFKGPFFLHHDGHKNPEAELIATVAAFLQPSAEQLQRLKMHPQCFYGARFKFLEPHLKLGPRQKVSCKERREWKSRLNAKGVSLIFAASDLGSATSSFGHLFIKLRNPENAGGKELIDYGMNYAADANQAEGVLYALKGLFGFYAGRFTMLPFHQKIREYSNMEGRDLWEYQLNFTPEETEELVDHFLEMEQAQAPYYFLSDNCAYQVAKALEAVRPSLKITDELPMQSIPLDILKQATRRPGLVTNVLYTRSLKSDYLGAYRRLNDRQRELLKTAVDNRAVPAESELSAEKLGEVYEGAMKYFALKAYQTGQDFDAEKYQFSVARARLGAVTQPPTLSAPTSPDQAHDSAAIYAGVGHNPFDGPFYSLKFRSAFHDMEQSDVGMVEFSQIEIASLEARYFTKSSRLSMSRLTLVNLINTSPVNSIDHNLSWRALIEFLDPWRLNFIGGAGISYDIVPSLRFTQLFNARFYNDFLGAGPNIILAARPMRRLGLSLDAGYYWGLEGLKRRELRVRANWQLSRNWDLQLEHLNQKEFHAKVLYNFLF